MIHNLIHITIHKINPKATFTIDNDTDKPKSTIMTTSSSKSLEAKLAEVQAEYDAEEWKRNRQAEYPSHEECIHALLDGGDTLINFRKIDSLKTKYPIRNI